MVSSAGAFNADRRRTNGSPIVATAGGERAQGMHYRESHFIGRMNARPILWCERRK